MQSARGQEPAIIVLSDDEEEQAGPSHQQSTPRHPKRQKRAAPAAAAGPATTPGPVHSPPVRINWRQAPASSSGRAAGNEGMGVVDLTSASPEDDVVLLSATTQPGSKKKRRVSLVLPKDVLPAVDAKDPQCAICMEPMKAMSCGPCGHVFCDSCLRAAVKAQKKCPTCRKTIAVRQIHRIYLNLP